MTTPQRPGVQGLWWLLLSIACASLGCVEAASATTAAAAMMLPSGRVPSARILHVAVHLEPDWTLRQVLAEARIRLIPLAGRRVSLDAAHLEIQGVSDGAGRPLAFSHDGSARDDALAITLAHEPLPGDVVELRIRYRTTWINHSDPANLGGSVGRGLRFFAPGAADRRRERQLWAAGDPGTSRYWLPGIDDPAMLRPAQISATLPRDLQLMGGGDAAQVQEEADGRQRWTLRIDSPHAPHRTLFVIGRVTDHPQHEGGVALHNLGYPHEAAGVAASVRRLPEMLRWLSGLLGTPLPQHRFSQVFVQDFPWGHAAPGLAMQTENMVDDEGTHEDFQYLWNGLQAEGLAQQWFGVSLATASVEHLWLERALAHHVAGLWSQHAFGADEYRLWVLLFGHNSYHADQAAGLRQPVRNPRYREEPGWAGGNAPGFQGAAVLQLLREEVGDSAWFEALRLYVQRHAGRTVTTDDLQAAVEAASGRPLGWFFDQWVSGIGHPVFEVETRYDRARRSLILTLHQQQEPVADTPHPQTRWFQGHIEVDIDGQLHRRWLAPEQRNVFSFELPAAPGYVQVDPGGSWIKTLRQSRSLDETLRQLQLTPHAMSRQAAATDLLARALDAQGSAEDAARIAAGLREIAARPAWWRIRFNALNQLRSLHAPAASAEPGAPSRLDVATRELALQIVEQERSWLRAAALNLLGDSRDPALAPVYLRHLRDPSDRVVNAAAIALGRSGSPIAFEALSALPAHPSWKNQSLISALAGLAEVKDPRAVPIALRALQDVQGERWTLATPVWDYRQTAAQTLAALGAGAQGVPIVLSLLRGALAEDQRHDIFSQLQLLALLGDASGAAGFDLAQQHFRHDSAMEDAVRTLAQRLTQGPRGP
ncbi:MAG: HEAT repeat domain-containing protein [Rubrivivax sp.]|nr:HEAT repeat domain-containing protein [Rubrivivax sp.]